MALLPLPRKQRPARLGAGRHCQLAPPVTARKSHGRLRVAQASYYEPDLSVAVCVLDHLPWGRTEIGKEVEVDVLILQRQELVRAFG